LDGAWWLPLSEETEELQLFCVSVIPVTADASLCGSAE
jgi:hypothetical protein